MPGGRVRSLGGARAYRSRTTRSGHNPLTIVPRSTIRGGIPRLLSPSGLLARKLSGELLVDARAIGGAVGRREDLPQFALAVARDLQELLCHPDGFFLRCGLEQGEPGNDLLRLRERTIGHDDVAAGRSDAGPQCGRQAAFRM